MDVQRKYTVQRSQFLHLKCMPAKKIILENNAVQELAISIMNLFPVKARQHARIQALLLIYNAKPVMIRAVRQETANIQMGHILNAMILQLVHIRK